MGAAQRVERGNVARVRRVLTECSDDMPIAYLDWLCVSWLGNPAVTGMVGAPRLCPVVGLPFPVSAFPVIAEGCVRYTHF
jgi:hypothetical protein